MSGPTVTSPGTTDIATDTVAIMIPHVRKILILVIKYASMSALRMFVRETLHSGNKGHQICALHVN